MSPVVSDSGGWTWEHIHIQTIFAYHQGTTQAARLIAALKLEPFTRMMLNEWNPWGQA